jgi:16S rRNA (uracil1498-N3)-methyltransferase
VLRLRAGDAFVAFDPAARAEADATLVEASGEAARVCFGPLRPASVVATAPVVLVYGLAKGDKVDAVVRDATELGATRILLARTERAITRLEGERAVARVERWRRIAEQAARQCGRADPPAIDGVLDWREALETAAEGDAVARFCLWERATAPLGPPLCAAIGAQRAVAFAVGPEGGLTAEEVDEAGALGFLPVSLGRFVLRTETVAAAVLGATRILADA